MNNYPHGGGFDYFGGGEFPTVDKFTSGGAESAAIYGNRWGSSGGSGRNVVFLYCTEGCSAGEGDADCVHISTVWSADGDSAGGRTIDWQDSDWDVIDGWGNCIINSGLG